MQRRDEKFPDNGFEAWGGYMQAKVAKLEEQFSSKAENENKISNILSGISIYVNGFTTPSADELKELMARHGGVYHTYQRSEDFIIASNLPDTKVKNMGLGRVVKPQWITDSIAAGRLLDYKEYLLYRNSKSQTTLKFNQKIKSVSILEQQSHTTKIDNLYNPSNHGNLDESNKNIETKVSSTSITNVKSEVTKTAADPNFIAEFYNNSRLHHISQLGACFKQHVNDLRENSSFEFPNRLNLKTRVRELNKISTGISKSSFLSGKVIMHIDMDCFFVSVGLRNRPELRGKPVAVTHSKGGQVRSKRSGVDREAEFNLYKQKQFKKLSKASGMVEDDIEIETRVDNIADEDEKFGSMSEIASCSYEARAKGITNGMFMGPALRLCPDLKTIAYDFDGYKEVAYTLYNTIAQYTLDIEAVSCDEMYVDCTDILEKLEINVDEFATALRDEIKSKTGCPCSTGFGSNRLQARLATKKAKPDGQFFMTSDFIDDFMFGIKLRDLPGVGRQTSQKLESLGHQTCGSLQCLSLANLQQHLGNKTGEQLYNQCRGHDPNPLNYHTVRKSVSAEVNYGIRFDNISQCEEFLKQLAAEVNSRMQQFKVIGKCITLKLMVRAKDAPVETAKFMGHGFCDVINKSTNLATATSDVNVISKEIISLCRKLNIDPKEMRGIGIQITKLESIKSKVKGSINKFLTTKTFAKSENIKIPPKLKLETEYVHNNTEAKEINSKTPIKSKKLSEVKSPIIGSIKSPVGRKRGRPSKTAKSHIPTQNLMSRFLQGQNILSEISIKKDVKENPIEVIKIKEIKCHGLLGLPWDKVRELLRAWFDSGQVPKLCDVNLISQYMSQMVTDRNIDKLYILLNFMRRRIREINSDIWNEVQDCVIEAVQNTMVAVYGKKMWLSDE